MVVIDNNKMEKVVSLIIVIAIILTIRMVIIINDDIVVNAYSWGLTGGSLMLVLI